MGKLSPKDEACILIFAALILMCSASSRQYFNQSRKLSWDEARKQCQLCFKDLVTVTSDNVQTIAQNLTADHWIGLRKNFYYTSNSTSNSTNNSTSYTTSSPISYSTSYSTSYSSSYSPSYSTSNFTSNSTSNSTSSTSLIWSRWANGERLIFQNWYPGWPVFKSHFPKRDCCSCSCTCPARTTVAPATTTTTATITSPSTDYRTPNFTTDDMMNSTSLWDSRMQNGTNDTTDVYSVTENMMNSTSLWDSRMENGTNVTTDVYNVTENMMNSTSLWDSRMENGTNVTTDVYNVTENMMNSTSLWDSRMENGTNDTTENGTTATPYTTAVPPTTTAAPTTPTLPLESECVRSPMLFPDVPDPDENYIEDSCVAMLSFGPWVEKNCFELLPYICYDDDFDFETSVNNLTSVSANLTWLVSVPGVTHYELEVKGGETTTNLTNSTHGLVGLTPGTHYSVRVFPIKCGRDLKAQEFSFTTIPKEVENFKVFNQNATSTLYLSWQKPVGHVDVYLIRYSGGEFETKSTHAEVGKLTPGGLYTFTIISVAIDPNTTRVTSEESTVTVYTKPEKVSNLKASNNKNDSLLLSWDPPKGNTTGYWVWATDENDALSFNETVRETKVNVTGLPMSQKISLSVIALANDTLKGEKVTISSFTAPGPISNLVLTTAHNNLTANWSATSMGKFSQFNIELKLDSKTVEKHNISKPRKTFDNLKTAANYTVIVYIINGHVKGPAVERSTYTLPSPPTNPIITSHDKEQITLSWTAPANSSTVTYVVEIKSDFWEYNCSHVVLNDTQHKFTGLKSGSKYSLTVKTKAGERCSLPVGTSKSTDPDIRHITLSMLCSSKESLLCENSGIKKKVFEQLNERFKDHFGSSVFWNFEKDTVD